MRRILERRGWLLISTLSALALGAGAGCGSSSGGESPEDGGPSESGVDGGEDALPTEGGTDGMMMADGHATDGPSNGDAPSDGSTGPLAISQLTMTGAFSAIFDAVPSPDGTKVYFSGADEMGNLAAWSVPVMSGPQTAMQVTAAGSPVVAPLGVAVSSDDTRLYVADPGAIDQMGGDDGVIWVVALPSGIPSQVAGSGGIYARGITVSTSGGSDTLVFTGVNGSGQAGLFTLAAGGGTAMTVVAGAPFDDPSGVTEDSSGNYFVFDVTAGGSHRADVIKVAGGTPSVVMSDLFVGYPAGITMNGAGNSIVLSGLAAPSGPDTLTVVSATGQMSPLVSSGLSKLSNAGGLHRAANANVYAFVDSAGDGTDAVYVIR